LALAKINTLYIGCPIWNHPSWFGCLYPPKSSGIAPLTSYAGMFNSVEGNSSFYHLPDKTTLAQWATLLPNHFRFTLKLPRSMSHQGDLRQCGDLLQQALEHFSLLGNKLGSVMLQLPASFGPNQLPSLQHFVAHFPQDFCLAVEVRHPAFFAKGEAERRLNQLLNHHQADRIIMDTRALFACDASQYPAPQAELIREVQSKKPQVPTNVIATGKYPIVRFVGHADIEKSKHFYQPWLGKIKQWLTEGLSPSLFFHMPDNKDAPWLAATFMQDLHRLYPELGLADLTLPAEFGQQKSLFDT
jgi:uncharacterized protein YecE (DUF72 family)